METLTVPGTLDSLAPIAQYVMAAATEAGLGKKAVYKLRLAVDEMASNIIIHGYQQSRLTGDIVVTAQLTDEQLIITLEDTAVAYDPTTHHLPTEEDLNRSLIQRPHGGLGIFLVLDGVDDFSYERVDDRNRNIFVMKLPTPTIYSVSCSQEVHYQC